jgi:hypothetical protein
MRFHLIPVALLTGTLALVGCEAAAPTRSLAPSDASLATGVKENQWVVVDRSVTDPCAPEAVYITGKAHVQTKESTDRDGTTKIYMHLNYAGVTGVGVTTELEYQVIGASKDVAFIYPSGAFSEEVRETFQLVSRGNTDNFQSHFVAVLRIDEDGNVTQTIEDRQSCRG